MAFDSNNNAAKDLFVVVDLDGKGKGLQAETGIKSGTLLMQDTALLVIQHDIMLKERVARNSWSKWKILLAWLEVILAGLMVLVTYQSWLIVAVSLVILSCQRMSKHIINTKSFILFQLSWQNLISQIKSLNQVYKSEFESLQNVFPFADPYQDWLGIFCTNSFQLGESDKSGLFLKVSRLNHSCRANCDYILQNGCIEVRTIRPITAGEELTICYNNFLEEDGPVVKSERKEYLQWAYRFTCKCEDCILSGFISQTNDQMRQRLVKLRKDWTITQDFRQERQIVDEQISLLLKLASCGKMEYILQAVECGWETEMNKGEHMSSQVGQFERKIDRDRADFVLQLGRTLNRTLFGVDSKESREWEIKGQKIRNKEETS